MEINGNKWNVPPLPVIGGTFSQDRSVHKKLVKTD